MKISDLLKGKDTQEKGRIKAREIAKFSHTGKFKIDGFDIEIISLSAIEVKGVAGVELFARAWKNGQIGFGDGTIETERFRIFNPAILVDDPNGDIVRDWVDKDFGPQVRRLREDPIQAIRETLAHTIKVSTKNVPQGRIIKGTVGHTTDTYYPAAGNNAPIDGDLFRDGQNATYSSIRGGTGTGTASTGTSSASKLQASSTTNQFAVIDRTVVGFDTSPITSAGIISSATLSLYRISSAATIELGTPNVDIVTSTLAASNALANGDFGIANFGSTRLATGIAFSSMANAYNDFALNASGLSAINKTTYTFFGMLNSWEVDNSFGGVWTSGGRTVVSVFNADQTGTTNDPKLVVTYALGVAFDAAGNSGDQAAASSYSGSASWSGTNRMLAIDVSMLGPGVTVSSMTYGGANCTFIGAKSTVTSFGRVECWRICSSDSGAPAAGSNTLSVTLSGSLEFSVEWASYTNVHQSSPTEGFNSAQATNAGSATDASVVITSVEDNCWIHAAVVANDTSITANQTSRNNISGTLGSGANEDNNAAVTPAGNTTMSYTGMGTLTTWAIAGYAIIPLADVGPSVSPSISPSISPSKSPSISPSISPSLSPSLSPSVSPSVSPSLSLSPSVSPSVSPSLSPSVSPSLSPSVSPSKSPSLSPSVSPSPACLTDDFESYGNGNLAGQGPWILMPGSPGSPQVQSSVAHTGSKSIKLSGIGTVSQAAYTDNISSTGEQLFYIRVHSDSGIGHFGYGQINFASSTPTGGDNPFSIFFGHDNAAVSTNVIELHTTGEGTQGFSALNNDQWYKLRITWDGSNVTADLDDGTATRSGTYTGTIKYLAFYFWGDNTSDFVFVDDIDCITPSSSPSTSPSSSPSLSPSISPSLSSSISPSVSPSPSLSPSLSPSTSPSKSPSISPSLSPSVSPSISPSLSPSISPSISPSLSPSVSPSISPSSSPSPSPSLSPSVSPSFPPNETDAITAVTRIQQNMAFPQWIFGGEDADGDCALFKKGTSYDFTTWSSPVYQIGKNFDVLSVKFTVVGGITGNKKILPVLYFDNESFASVGTEINATTYPNGEQLISLTADNFEDGVHGRNNFYLQLRFTGTDLAVVKLPIRIKIDLL